MADGGFTFTLVFVNNSTMTNAACLFQQDPDLGPADVSPLAWLVESAAPTTKVSFQWQVTYSFFWDQVGHLTPGVICGASQDWPANLNTTNQVTFTDAGQVFTFKDQTAGPQTGVLTVIEDSTIPSGVAAVGIGMDGGGTFAVPSQPNTTLNFQPNPEYWITFGSYAQGEVLDVAEMSLAPAQIVFPVNVYSMTATLNADNTWTVAPTSTVNAAFVAARRTDPAARWGG